MQRAAKSTDACIVHQDIRSAKGRFDLTGGFFYRGKISHVAGKDFGYAAALYDRLGRRLECGAGTPAQDGCRAEIRQLASDCGPNPAPSSGNQGYLCFQRLIAAHKDPLIGNRNSTCRRTIFRVIQQHPSTMRMETREKSLPSKEEVLIIRPTPLAGSVALTSHRSSFFSDPAKKRRALRHDLESDYLSE
jgi:hypothetical protein